MCWSLSGSEGEAGVLRTFTTFIFLPTQRAILAQMGGLSLSNRKVLLRKTNACIHFIGSILLGELIINYQLTS
jgi:hypothetical protein